MIKKSIITLVLSVLLFTVSCNEKENTDSTNNSSQTTTKTTTKFDAKSGKEIVFNIQIFSKKEGNCEGEKPNKCIEINIKYPEVSIGNDEIKDLINTYTKEQIINTLNLDSPEKEEEYKTVNEAIEGTISDFKEFTKDYPDGNSNWTFNLNGEIIFQTEKIVSMKISSDTYTGGAHPNYFENLISFDLENKQQLNVEDIAMDKDKLISIAEKKFREKRNLDESADLNKEGYFFENNKFELNENFALTKNGITFVFNPYEIAPYVMGSTEITMNYSELDGILTDNILKNIMIINSK